MDQRHHHLENPFSRPEHHQNTSAIIAGHSTNRRDIRDVALGGLDLSAVRSVLDLGCGFGFMAEAAAQRAASDAHVVGADLFEANRGSFLARVNATGRRATFLSLRLYNRLPFDDGCFDLVIASYSLYFFPNILPDVARVLKHGGLLVAVTHSERSFQGMLRAAGLPEGVGPLSNLIRRFSAENGAEALGPFFQDIERVDYLNQLVFTDEDLDELLAYLSFKAPFLSLGSAETDALPEAMVAAVRATMVTKGRVVIEKDDAVFRCRGPRGR